MRIKESEIPRKIRGSSSHGAEFDGAEIVCRFKEPTEEGELGLVRASPDRHEEIARFPVLEGRTWNHPVIADGYLLVRNVNEMAAFDLRVGR